MPTIDVPTKKKRQCVIILAAAAATFYIVTFNINTMNGSYGNQNGKNVAALWTAVSHLLMELSVPVCGYFGAVYNNRQLLCCFCSCSLFGAVLMVISFVQLQIIMSDRETCEGLEDASQRQSCEVWKADDAQKWISLTSTVWIMALGFLAFWSGNSLYSRLSRDPPAVPTTALVGEVVSLEPRSSPTMVQPGDSTAREARNSSAEHRQWASRWETSEWLPLPGTLPALGNFRRPHWLGTTSV